MINFEKKNDRYQFEMNYPQHANYLFIYLFTIYPHLYKL